MRRIYTRTGDDGTTAIHGGTRVSKTDSRIKATGSLDELNVAIGTARAFLSTDHPWQQLLKEIQLTLMTIMSRVSTPSRKRDDNPNRLPSANPAADLEPIIDDITLQSGEATHFVLPGGTPASAFLHQARVEARRAERCLWHLNESDPVEPAVLQYVNRLSDLLFAMARADVVTSGIDEERWNLFSYNRTARK